MDFSKLIETEKTFPVSLKSPIDGSDMGIVFNIVSAQADRVVKAMRKVTSERYKREAAGEDHDIIEASQGLQRAQFIACIDSWEWNGNSWGELGVDPVCNDETKAWLFDQSAAFWVVNQINDAVGRIENFTNPELKPARTSSKKK